MLPLSQPSSQWLQRHACGEKQTCMELQGEGEACSKFQLFTQPLQLYTCGRSQTQVNMDLPGEEWA